MDKGSVNGHPQEPPAPGGEKGGAGDSRSQGGPYSRIGPALSLGTTMAAGMLLFAGLGYWIDAKRGGGRLWTICGLLLGFVFGMYEMWKAARDLGNGPQGTPAARPPQPKDGDE
jgi:F0F1-type ATP synthase assembly protein I